MVSKLFVPKRYGTYADTFMMLGLAQLAEYALGQTNHKREIVMVDEGTRYRLQFKQEVDLEAIATLKPTDLFPPVLGAKTDASGIPEEVKPLAFNTVQKAEERKLYREYLYQGGKKLELGDDAPEPPDPRTQNGVILTSMRHDRNHNGLWAEAWNIQENFGKLIAAIFQAFGQDNLLAEGTETQKVAELLGKTFKLPAQASAVKIFMPTAVQGVNRLKADSNKSSDSQKEDWLTLWLIAAGLFEFGLSERVKVAESTYDWRVVALEPRDISLNQYRVVLDELRKYDPPSGGHGIARFDTELVLKFSRELLNHYPAKDAPEPQQQSRRFRGQSIRDFVTGFSGTHFGSKGQVYGVKEILSLGLPDWLRPDTPQEVLEYLGVLREHLAIVRSLSADEGHSELLAAYRDFITSSNLNQFFRFQASYADYIVKRLANSQTKFPPARFSKEGLDTMTQSFNTRKNDKDWLLTEITEDSGFLRIAQAINSATVYAGTVRDKDGNTKDTGWERMYGLAQRLSSQAGSKKDFIIEITSFLAAYENENLRIDDELRKKDKPRRIWTTKDDLDRLVRLIDKFGSSLVGNLLIAYGYAKGWGKTSDSEPQGIQSQNTSKTSKEVA
jgi:hypothetical protein